MVSTNEQNEADFRILMIGQRRTGKSSVLSAMLKKMQSLKTETGFQFEADPDTEILMRTKLSNLERIFYLYQRDETFSTLMGEKDGEDYSSMTDVAVYYKFFLSLAKDQKGEKYSVEFTDIRGEDMLSSMGKEDEKVSERFKKSNIILIAVDSPALMEYNGNYAEAVNAPDNIYECIKDADFASRKEFGDDKSIPPKMVLFVPLKCEKYYHENRMRELVEALKSRYKNVLAFLGARKEYTVVVTPILTLGEVVFHDYETVTGRNGKKRPRLLRDEDKNVPETMRNIPKSPLFRFRSQNSSFSPQFCEQPLLYILAYVMSMEKYIQEMEKREAKKQNRFSVLNLLKHAALFYFFGLFYVAFLGAQHMLANKDFKVQAVKTLNEHIILDDPDKGYVILQDNMNLKGVKALC